MEKPVLKILVVDDEPLLCEILKEEFEDDAWEVTEAYSGLTAWELLKKNHFDAVLSDIRMPLGNGLELLDKIKKDDQTKNIAVFLATGHSEIDVEAVKSRGGEGLFTKPYDIDQIKAAIKSVLKFS